ncbi:hypothetical protein CWN26_24370 [Klebsiella pneumoniae]|nr:hypothetical protein [Finegoldia magna]PLL51946.1 hypothetical protein CWN26_24370 [Klebsiella pneumoniae]
MILDYTSFYISCKNHGRLVRYDVIKLDYESYLIKVFAGETNEGSFPNPLIQLDEFQLTRSDFLQAFEKDGFELAIKYNRPPTFESYLYISCQLHRDGIS